LRIFSFMLFPGAPFVSFGGRAVNAAGCLGPAALGEDRASAGARLGPPRRAELCVCSSGRTLSLHDCYGQSLLQLLALKLPGLVLLPRTLPALCRHLLAPLVAGCSSPEARGPLLAGSDGSSAGSSGACQLMAIGLDEPPSRTHSGCARGEGWCPGSCLPAQL